MKKVKVQLLDENKNVVLEHNLYASGEADATNKGILLVENARDKRVVDFKILN